MVFRAIPGRNAARAIARNLRLGAIGVQQTNAQIGILGGQDPLHSVGADAIVPIADAAGELVNVAGRVGEIDDQKIVAAGRGFHEGTFAISVALGNRG